MDKKLSDKFSVRRATVEDMESVRAMIQELADFEQMSHRPKLTTEDLIRDSGLNGHQEFFHCYIAEMNNSEPNRPLTRTPIGYAICFFSYSTWEGKAYFLEDLYIKPLFRRLGLGTFFFSEIIRMAVNYNCCRLNFYVLKWNPAKDFYEKFGAISITAKEGWEFYALDRQQMDKLLNN